MLDMLDINYSFNPCFNGTYSLTLVKAVNRIAMKKF